MRRLLLLHGFTGTKSSWDEVERALDESVETLALSLTGHEKPITAPEISTFEAEVDRLESQLSPGPWEVIGYSLGARLALGLLVRHPERFTRAMLISGRPGLETQAERDERCARDERLAQTLERNGLDAFIDSWEREPLFGSQLELPELTRQGERARRMSHDPRGLAHSLRVTGLGRMPNYWPCLAALQMPIEVLAGSLDPAFCALGEAVVGKLPKARFTRVPGAGHNLLLERPHEVARAIARGP
jgi:2-succinyl-6-hydroxy-2,4-cyclohexadiene-1-carboxylate synthase